MSESIYLFLMVILTLIIILFWYKCYCGIRSNKNTDIITTSTLMPNTPIANIPITNLPIAIATPIIPDPIIPDPIIPDPIIPDPVLPDTLLPDPVLEYNTNTNTTTNNPNTNNTTIRDNILPPMSGITGTYLSNDKNVLINVTHQVTGNQDIIYVNFAKKGVMFVGPMYNGIANISYTFQSVSGSVITYLGLSWDYGNNISLTDSTLNNITLFNRVL